MDKRRLLGELLSGQTTPARIAAGLHGPADTALAEWLRGLADGGGGGHDPAELRRLATAVEESAAGIRFVLAINLPQVLSSLCGADRHLIPAALWTLRRTASDP